MPGLAWLLENQLLRTENQLPRTADFFRRRKETSPPLAPSNRKASSKPKQGQRPFLPQLRKGSAVQIKACSRSEGTATEEQDEHHGGASQGDQGQGGEVGDQVKINAHESARR